MKSPVITHYLYYRLILPFHWFIQIILFISYIYYIMSIDPLQSVKNKIHLPAKCNISQMTKLFTPLSKDTDSHLYQLSQPLFNKTNQLVDQLNESFQIYKQEKDYVFVFPDSLFPDVPPGERNQITYEQVMISEQENTFKNKLSEEQLEEIAEKGEFKVKSNIEYVTLPYVWKINETLFWGRDKTLLVWKSSLARIFGIFSEAKRRLFSFVPRALAKIKKIPSTLFKILVGAKSLRTAVSVNYEEEVTLDFWKRIISDYYKESEQWSSALWNYLFVYYDPEQQRPVEYSDDVMINTKRQQARKQLTDTYHNNNNQAHFRMERIKGVQTKFNQQWNKLKKKVILQIGEEVNGANSSIDNKPESEEELLVNGSKDDSSKNDDKIIQLLAERKFSLSLDYMRQELPKVNVPLDVINAIVTILRLFKVLNSRYAAKTKLLAKKRKEVEEAVRKRHPIKSLYTPFFNEKVEAEYKVIQNAINEEIHENLVKDREFNALLNESQKAVLREYLKFRTNFNTLIQAKKNELKQLHSPTRTFYSNYHLLPPYQVIQTNGYYSLKKISDDLTVDTNTNFWKLKLYWMRMKTWTINCFIALLFLVWNGPTGLRCLYGKEDFGYEMEINYQTGEIYYQKRKTVIGTFLTVLEGIKKSRDNFQATPDLGLLGKNISRYFNYMECYLFRFLLVGVVLTLIGYPIVIVVASVISFVLVITIWAWVPIILLVTYTFNIFIYQFQSALIPDRLVVRSLPIFGIIFHIIRSIVLTVLLTLNLVLLAPIKALFIFLFSVTQRCFRTLVDKLLLFLFRKVGRTPSRDTSIARKISGPGMSKEFYMSINQEDVYVLMQSKLQQIFMQKLGTLIEQQINDNHTKASEVMSTVLRPFSTYNHNLNYIYQNSSNLLQNYRVQYHNYMARYPSFPTRVRFTQEEIDSYFDNTVNIVRNFVTKHEIEKWIFEKYELYEDMYDELTRSLWMEIFNCGEEIFEPLEKLDARFKLEDQYHNEDNDVFNQNMKRNVNQIVKSLEGEVFLSHKKQKVAPFKHNLIHREQQTEEISHVFDIWKANSQTFVSLNRQMAHTAFIPNLNINEIATLHHQRREREIKGNPDIVDL